MDALETLITIAINNLSVQNSCVLVKSINFVALHYTDIIEVVRWFTPCVITSCLLLFFVTSQSNAME